MKKILSVVICFVLIVSCNEHELFKSESKYESEIKNFLDEQASSHPDNKDSFDELKNSIHFHRVQKYTLKDGRVVLMTSSDKLNLQYKVQHQNLQRVLFFMNEDKVAGGMIVNFGSSSESGIEDLISTMLEAREHNYSGTFYVFNLFLNLTIANEYENGRAFKTGRVKAKGPAKSDSGGKLNACTDWYLITTIRYTNGSTTVLEEYVGTSCSCEQNETRTSGTQCGGGDNGSQSLPTNPVQGQRWSITYPNGVYRELEYQCYDWGCIWRPVVSILPEIVVEADRYLYPFLPIDPAPNAQIFGPDASLYTYNGDLGTWHMQTSPNRLCGAYSWITNGDGYSATIIYLAAPALHRPSGDFLFPMWGSVCVTYGSSTGIQNQSYASSVFNAAWGQTMDAAQAWLNAQATTPTTVQYANFITATMLTKIQAEAQGYVSLNWAMPCGGNVPETVTRYCN